MIKNKKVTAWLVLSICIVSAFATVANAADGAKLSQIVQLGEKNNPVVFAQQQRERQATAALNETTAKMMPKLNAIYGSLWSQNPIIDLGSLGGLAELVGNKNPMTDKNIYAAAAVLTQTIYAGGSLSSMKAAAKLALEATKAESIRTTQTVDNVVRRTYFAYKRAEAKQEVARTAVKLANDHLKQAEQMFASGIVSKADVLRAQVAVADADLNLIRATNALDLSLVALERAVGAEIPKELLAGEDAGTFELKEEGNVNEAYNSRAELKMYDLHSKRAAKIARASMGQSLPQILGYATYANIANTAWPEGNGSWYAGLAARWQLFDSGETHARTEQARSQSKELLYRLEDKKNEVKMEVRQAELNLKAAKARYEVAKRQLTQSEEDYRIAVLRYKENVGTNLDMLDARLAYTDSQSNVVDAKYDIAIAEANLFFAVGK